MGEIKLLNNITKDVPQSKIEQYKLYVEMMDKISERRAATNSFFVALNTVVITLFGILRNENMKYNWLIIVGGLSISYIWGYTLKSYKLLNTGKFKVIHEMELELHFNCYAYEWQILGNGKDKNKYLPISHVEKIVPIVFAVIYILAGIFMILFA